MFSENKKGTAFFPILILSFLLLSQSALAQGIVPCGHGSPCTLCHLIVGIHNLVDFGLKLLIVAALAAITIAGVMYVISAGSDTMMTSAKNFLRSSVVGFALVLAAWLIVSVIMWLISAKEDLGIGKTGWRNGSITYECSTQSSATSSPNNNSDATSKCCVKTQEKNDPRFGNADENCNEPVEKDGEKTCPDGTGTLTDGACSSLPACGAKQSSSTCEATNNGCGGLGGNTNGCDHTSAELAAALKCMNEKKGEYGVTPQISSVTLNRHSDWCDKCVNSYAGEDYCAHKQNSCHFGGRNCKGISQAVDLVGGDMNKIASLAKTCGFNYTLIHGSPVHVHASVNNSTCGCH